MHQSFSQLIAYMCSDGYNFKRLKNGVITVYFKIFVEQIFLGYWQDDRKRQIIIICTPGF